MKKIFILLCTCMFMVACSSKKQEVVEDDTPQHTVLILYYSQTGATASVANQLKSCMDADIEEIICEKPYDGDFNATIERCKKEREKGEIPAIKPIKSDIKKYMARKFYTLTQSFCRRKNIRQIDFPYTAKK